MKVPLQTCPVDENVDARTRMYLLLYQLDNSALAEHSIESGHWIKFHETEVLAKTSGHMNWLLKEATEIKLHADNINRGRVQTQQKVES
jgi:hypothetical protein